MSEQKPQTTITERDLEVIKQAFQGNDALLKTMRALFFGMGVTDAEKELILKTFSNDELFAVVSNRFYPQLNKETPIGQAQDVWLGAETMVFGAPKDTIQQAIEYKNRALKMTHVALGLLRNPDGEAPRVRYVPDEIVGDELGLELLARNQYVRHIENQLLFLKVIADTKKETTQETTKRVQQNSAK